MPRSAHAWDEIDIASAEQRIRGEVIRTPLIRAPPGLETSSTPVYLKLENFQRGGAFKIRGAMNKIASLSDAERARGVITASSGNHAQGVGWAARRFGVPATIVMAERASPLKVRATEALGARIIRHGRDYDDAYAHALQVGREEGLTFVHPYDDPWIIAGQATVGREILEDLPSVRRVIAGVGGGGLLSGIASALRQAGSTAEVVGVQPSGASTLKPSLADGRLVVGPPPDTFADGIATRHLGRLPFSILSEANARAVVVDDTTIARAVFLLLERGRIVAEGAGASPLAATFVEPTLLEDGPVVLVVSGGNLDPYLLGRILEVGLISEGRLIRLRVRLPETGAGVTDFLCIASENRARVRDIVPGETDPSHGGTGSPVEVDLEVRDVDHGLEVLQRYRERGWDVVPIPRSEHSVTLRVS